MNIDIVQELRNQADLAHAVTGCSLRNHPLTKAADEIESLRQQINDLVSAHAITSMQTEQPAVAEVRCRNGEVFGYIGRQVFRDMLPLGTKLYTHANQSTPVDTPLSENEPHWFKVIHAGHTHYNGKDKEYALSKAQKLSEKNPKVMCSVESVKIIWLNDSANTLLEAITNQKAGE